MRIEGEPYDGRFAGRRPALPELRHAEDEDYGVSTTGPNREYCRCCWRDGRFAEPDIELGAMIDRCVGIMVAQGVMPPEPARALMEKTLPTLKRWRQGRKSS